MTLTLILVAYSVGYVVTWRRLAYYFSYEFAPYSGPEWGDVLFGAFMATFIGLIWPIVAVLHGIRLFAQHRQMNPGQMIAKLGSAPHEAKVEQLEREASKRERYIADLERQLEVR